VTATQPAGIGEVDVQDVLARALAGAASFRDRLLARIGQGDFATDTGARFVRAVRSVHEADGETDVQADWMRDGIGRLRLMVEVKLGAQFMPQQGARYRARAARALAAGRADRATTVLLAPTSYFEGANVEARHFDLSVSLEEVLPWISDCDAPGAVLIREALDRLAAGQPLGGKGLFRSMHDAIAREIDARALPFRVTNHATDWVFLDHPAAGKGVRFRYRIREGVAELRLDKSFSGAHTLPGVTRPAYVVHLPRNTETVYRHSGLRVSDRTRAGTATDADVGAIVAALDELARWWAGRGSVGAPGI
jgi:hypothetical protein